MKFGIAALVLVGSSLAPAAGAFSYLDSIAPKGGSPPENYAYSVSGKIFNPVASPTAAGSSYLDGVANGMIASNVHGETPSSSIDNSADVLIRSEYNAWLKRYGKTADESRYPTFKANILALQQNGRQTDGKCYQLNEYAEYSAEEFAQLNAGSTSNNAPTAVSGSASATPNTSYAPGAGGKPAAPVSSGTGSYLSAVTQVVAAAAPQSYDPVTASSAPPAAAPVASGASYLSSLSNPGTMGSKSSVPKKDYAPGKNPKPTAPASSGIGSSYMSSLAPPPGAVAPQSYTPAAASSAPVAAVSARASYSTPVFIPVPNKGGYAIRQGSQHSAPLFPGDGSSPYVSSRIPVAKPGTSFASPGTSVPKPKPLAPAGTSKLQSSSKPANGWAMGSGGVFAPEQQDSKPMTRTRGIRNSIREQ